MQWVDEGIVLSLKPLQEKMVVASIFTKTQGLHRGVLTLSKKMIPLQVGCFVHASWKARLSHHLGTYKLEVLDSPFARLLTMPNHITTLNTISTLLDSALPERHAYNTLYENIKQMFEHFHHHDCIKLYATFEYQLVHELGFGFDLSECAICETSKEIAFLSPKTGRGACFDCGIPHKHKVFRFPLTTNTVKEQHQLLKITGFFLEEYAKIKLPALRECLISTLVP